MNKNEKRNAQKLASILAKNTSPPVQDTIRSAQIHKICLEAEKIEILSHHSIIEQIFIQASYISPWVWIIQAIFLSVLFYDTCQRNQIMVLSCIAVCAPCLTLILIHELAKSFSNNMWELEASSRYNLQQIMAMRMYLISGMDFILLTISLIAFRVLDGALWQFALYGLLPFFLLSAISLFLIGNQRQKCSNFVLCGITILIFIAMLPVIDSVSLEIEVVVKRAEAFKNGIGVATITAMLLYFLSAVKLCRTKYHNPEACMN